ncbi:seryl-tRNA synthetase [Thraustotheca clavata]|uniref:serine--tRNA ligase n=1 Tax=Thraustotheca clavata TaxID=74557 RepID=A0A1V9Z6R9_9STRA|nr:seryl-tRNA synthetase [Thraustotheca clavata]
MADASSRPAMGRSESSIPHAMESSWTNSMLRQSLPRSASAVSLPVHSGTSFQTPTHIMDHKTEAQFAAEMKHALSIVDKFFGPSVLQDHSIPRELLMEAQGLVFLTVYKLGFLVSGKGGKGFVMARTANGWSAPAFIGSGGVGFGMMVGGEVVNYIIILSSRGAVKTFTRNGQIQLGSELDLAVGPLGRAAAANLNVGRGGVAPNYSYSHSMGLYGGIGLAGAIIVSRKSFNDKCYGSHVRVKSLLAGEVACPLAQPLWEALDAVLNIKREYRNGVPVVNPRSAICHECGYANKTGARQCERESCQALLVYSTGIHSGKRTIGKLVLAPVSILNRHGSFHFGAMFKNTFQSGFLSILYSIGSKPLQIWDKQVRNGHIKRITDQDIQSSVLEIMGTNVSTNFIACPALPAKTLGIKLPFLVMIIKNLKKYFTFEVQVLDDKNVRRRFRASNYQSSTRVKPFICTMPMRLDEGWNQIQFNLSDFTRRAYGTNYIETLRVQIHANCRIRRIYFSDRLYSEEELPPEFKLFLPVPKGATNDQPKTESISIRAWRCFSTSSIKSRLDFKALCANVNAAVDNVAVRKSGGDPAKVAALYLQHGAQTQQVNLLRQERNALAKKGADEAARQRGRDIKNEIQSLETSLAQITEEMEREALLLPNHTHPESPHGPEENSVIKHVIGTMPTFDFTPRDHLDIAMDLDILDMNSKIAGSRFATLKNDGAMLELALVHWSMAKLRSKGFTVHLPPDVAHTSIVEGCGFQPRGEATQVYSVANTDLSLVGTAEIPLAALHADSILSTEELPLRVAAFGHCFRTEVGHGGKDTRGLYRIHQFSKVEMFAYSTLDQAEAMMKELLDVQIEIISELGLHAQVVDMATEDLGAPAYRKFDVLAYMPGRQSFNEISSLSNCTDYQARRLNIRHKNEQEKTQFVATLNGTACAIPRLIISILESYQQADGSVLIPNVLRPYYGGQDRIVKLIDDFFHPFMQ